MSTQYYTSEFRAGDIVIHDNTINITGTGDLNFTVNPGSKINFNLGNTTIEYGGTGAQLPPVRNPKVLSVTPTGAGGDFTSVKAAVDSVSGATSTNQYVIHVSPGVYVEDTITMKPYVDIEGAGLQLSTIKPTSITGPIIIGKANCCIKNLYLHGATAGTAVSATNLMSVYPFRVEQCYFGSNQKQVVLTNTIAAPSLLKVEGCYAGGLDNFTTGFEVVSTTGTGTSFMSIKGLTVADFVTPWFDTLIKANGPGAQLVVDGMLTRITPTTGAAPTTCFSVENGSECRAIANTIRGYERGFYIPTGGLAPRLEASGNNLECTLYNIDVGHTGALGSFTGYSEITKTRIPFGAPFFLTYLDPRIITVSKKGGDYTSIAAAVASITDASESNRYVISVAPGEYVEPLIDISDKPYVSINGSQIQSAKITPDLSGGDHHIFKIGQYNELSFLWIQGAPVGYAGIYAIDTGDYSQSHKITIVDCDTGILVKATNTDTVYYGEYIDVNGAMNTAFKCIVDNGDTGTAFMNLENCYVFPDDSGSRGIVISGVGAAADFMVGGLDYSGNDNTGTIGIEVLNGAVFASNAVYINGYERGISNPNSGTASDIKISSTNFTNSSTYDIFIGHPTTKLAFQGSAASSKISNASPITSWYFVDSETGVFEITNRINMTFNNVHKTDLSTLLLEGGTMGLLEGGELSSNPTGGTTVFVSQGYGYVDQLVGDVVKRIDWSDRSIALPDYSSNYIYITFDNVLDYSATAPDSEHNIILGRVDTYAGTISLIEKTPLVAHHAGNLNEHFNRDALGSIFNTGCIVSDGGGRELDVSGGNYFFGSAEFYPTGGTSIEFHEMYRNPGITGGWYINQTPVIVVDNTSYDNGTGTLASLSNNHRVKHSLYLSGDGIYQKYFLVYGQAQYGSLIEAEGAPIALPPTYFSDSIVLIANIIVKQGTSEIERIQDARPTLAFKASGVTASANHSNLLGLANDDHTQYLLVNGTRAMAGGLNMGTHAITGASSYNGVVIQTHASRHLPNGADPIASEIAVSIGSANATGTSNSYSRSNHVHAHGNQAGGTLHSAATTTANGFMSAADKVILNNIAASQLVTLNATGAIPNARVLGTNFFINNTHVSPTAAIDESKLALNFPTHTNANDPTADEKAALTGTFGIPSVSNRYVTESDPRIGSSILIPTANIVTDMTNLATIAAAQYDKGQPIYLHDTAPGGNANVGTPLYYNSTTGANPWNYLSWIGVGTTGVARAPFIAFTGAGCVFAAPMVLGLSFTLIGSGTTAFLNGGASVTTTWQIGDIFTDNSSSQDLTFGAGKYLVGRVEFSSSGIGKNVIIGDRGDVKITTLSLRGGELYCGSNSTLDVDLCSGVASVIYVGANSALTPQANSQVIVQNPANNTFQIYGSNASLTTSGTTGAAGITVQSSATGARIMGNSNTITVATGATNVVIIGNNTVTDFGTNTLILSAPNGLTTTNGVFRGTLSASGTTTLSSVSATAITGDSLSVTGATSLASLSASGNSTLGSVSASDITGATLNITGAASVNSLTVSGAFTSANITGASLNITGAAQVGGALSVSGNTVVSNLSATTITGASLTVTGATSLASLSASGNTTLVGVTGSSLNITGATALNTLSSTSISNSGNLTITNTGSTVFTNNILGTKELILGQTGDEFGASRLLIRNRTAENGIIMEATNGNNIDLVDFILKNNVAQRNIRLESRSGFARAGGTSFHIGGPNPDNPAMAFSDAVINTATGASVCIGGYLTSAAAKLHVTDVGAATSSAKFTNSNTGNTSADGLDIGYSTLAFVNNRENTALSLMTNNTERINIAAGGAVYITGALSVNGAVGLNTLSVTGATVANGVTTSSLNVTGATTTTSIVSTTLTATNITGASLNVTGATTLNTLTVTGNTNFGNVTNTNITGASLNITGASALNTLTVTTATGTNLNITGNSSLTTLTVSGNTVLAGVTGAALNVTGASTLSSLTLTGNTVLVGITGASLSITGAMSINGSTTLNTLAVSGNTILIGITGSSLNITGATTLASLIVTGNTNFGNVSNTNITGATLNITGASSLASLQVSGASTLNNTVATTITGASLNVTGATALNTLSVNGASTTASLTTTTLTSTTITGASLNITGASRFTSVIATGITGSSLSVTGATALNTLAVSGNTVLAGVTGVSLNITGATLLNTLTVSGNVSLGNLVSSNMTGASLNITGATALNTLTVSGASAFAGTLTASSITGTSLNVTSITNTGNQSVGGTLNVTGAASLGTTTVRNDLGVVGNANITGTLTTSSITNSGNASVGGTLNVTGATSLGATVVRNDLGVTGNETVGGTLGVSGLATFNNIVATGTSSLGVVNLTGALTVNNTTPSTNTTSGSGVFRGGVGISGALNVGGNLNMATGVVSAAGLIISNSATITNNIGIGGAVSITGALTVTGATTLTSVSSTSNTVSGNQSIGGTLNVTGATSLGATTVRNALGVTGLSTLSGGASTTTLTATTSVIGNGTQLSLRANSGNTSGSIRILTTDQSTAFDNGSVVLDGGLGVGGAVFANTSLNTGNLSITGSSIINSATDVDTELVTLGTGRVAVSANPTADLHISTKKYVDDVFIRRTKVKSIDTSLTNTTAFVLDASMSGFPIVVAKYLFKAMMFFVSNTNTPDFKYRIDANGTTSTFLALRSMQIGGATSNTTAGVSGLPFSIVAIQSTTTRSSLYVEGILNVTVGSGVLDFLWAPSALGVGQTTTLLSGSYIQLERVE
jgi:hypothetical protein